jgi:hypothetical protein
MSGTPPTSSNPALAALGDRLESAATTAVATGGLPPSGRSMAKLALIPVLALFVVAGLIIASVAPGGSADTAEAAIVSAARQTSERATGRFELTVEASGLAALAGTGSDTLTLTTTGAYDADQGLFSASIDTSQVLGWLGDGGVLDGVGPTIDAVVAGNDVYLDVSPLASLLGAEWVKVGLPDLAGEGGLPSVVDPGGVLDALEGAGADMDEAGRETVRGVETTRYTGSIDLQDAYDAIPADERDSLEQALGGLLDSVTLPDLPTDVWVDDEGLVRRVEISVDSGALGIDGLETVGAVSVSVEFFDIGEDVNIEVPGDDEVVSVDELTPERLLDGLGGLLDDFDFDLDSMLDGLDGLADDFDLDSMMEQLEDFLGDGTTPSDPGTPSTPAPDTNPSAPSTTVTV